MGDDAREIFARNLNDLMTRRGLSQADIAAKLDVTAAAVSAWCLGKKYPRIDVMQRLADLLGATLSALTTEEGLRTVDDMDRLEAMHQNPRLGLLFDRQRKMSNRDVEFMLEMANRILKERDNDWKMSMIFIPSVWRTCQLALRAFVTMTMTGMNLSFSIRACRMR